jgi:hypothetical protein
MDVDDWYADQLVELLEVGNGLPLLGQQLLDNVDCKKIPRHSDHELDEPNQPNSTCSLT